MKNRIPRDMIPEIHRHICASLKTSFSTPAALERYTLIKQAHRAIEKQLSHELDILSAHLSARTRSREYLWNKLISLIVRMHNPRHYSYNLFKDRVINLAEDILNVPPLPSSP